METEKRKRGRPKIAKDPMLKQELMCVHRRDYLFFKMLAKKLRLSVPVIMHEIVKQLQKKHPDIQLEGPPDLSLFGE